ncbi:hypothetical protein L9F63_012727, partial [Diploptera punctata]
GFKVNSLNLPLLSPTLNSVKLRRRTQNNSAIGQAYNVTATISRLWNLYQSKIPILDNGKKSPDSSYLEIIHNSILKT